MSAGPRWLVLLVVLLALALVRLPLLGSRLEANRLNVAAGRSLPLPVADLPNCNGGSGQADRPTASSSREAAAVARLRLAQGDCTGAFQVLGSISGPVADSMRLRICLSLHQVACALDAMSSLNGGAAMADWLTRIASAREQSGDHQTALDAFRVAETSGAVGPTTAVLYSQALAAAGKQDEAIAVLENSLQDTPLDAALHYRLGVLLWEAQPGSPEGLRHVEEAVRLRGENFSYRNRLGSFYLWFQRSDDAGVQLQAALAESPDNPDVLMNLGHAAGQKGDWSAAVRFYFLARQGRGSTPEVLQALKNACSRTSLPSECGAFERG